MLLSVEVGHVPRQHVFVTEHTTRLRGQRFEAAWAWADGQYLAECNTKMQSMLHSTMPSTDCVSSPGTCNCTACGNTQ